MTLLLLCLFAFLAGFIDAIVGGGGLIQLPAMLLLLPGAVVGQSGRPGAALLQQLLVPALRQQMRKRKALLLGQLRQRRLL